MCFNLILMNCAILGFKDFWTEKQFKPRLLFADPLLLSKHFWLCLSVVLWHQWCKGLKFPVLCPHYFSWLRICESRCTLKTLKLDLLVTFGSGLAGVINGACRHLWHYVPSCNFLGSLGTHYTDIITSLKTHTTVCTYTKHSSRCRLPESSVDVLRLREACSVSNGIEMLDRGWVHNSSHHCIQSHVLWTLPLLFSSMVDATLKHLIFLLLLILYGCLADHPVQQRVISNNVSVLWSTFWIT